MVQDTSKINQTKENKEYSMISSLEKYQELYRKSIESPEEFWSEVAENFYWKTGPSKEFLTYNFDHRKGPISIKYMVGATTNVCYNVLDRNIKNGLGDNIAFYWESNDSKTRREMTYSELHIEVSKFANVLKSLGVKKGDRIAIYMPVMIEYVVAMLACARIGAVHVAVFAGLSAESLADRLISARCEVLVSVDGAFRCDKFIDFMKICTEAIFICQKSNFRIKYSIVKKHCGIIEFYSDQDTFVSWDKQMECAPDNCDPEWMDAEDPLFIMCTSGSTGKPKCIVHTTGGFLLWVYLQSKSVLNSRKGEIIFSTADIGWIVGHTYSVYGPLANSSTVVLMEGSPIYPTVDRVWQIIDRYRVTTFFTSPTTVRTLMKYGDENLGQYNRDSLRILSTGGEPLNPDVWLWLWDVVGRQRCAIVDSFGQTEGSATMITNFPGVPMLPCSSGFPFFGVQPVILDENGNELTGEGEGYLVFKGPWPGIARTLNGNHDLFAQSYFQKFPGYLFSGDAVRRNKEGYYWVVNRIDDMLKVSGRLISTVEVENAIYQVKSVAEAAAVSASDPIKGHSIHVFLVLNNGFRFDEEMEKSILQNVCAKIGGLARPSKFHVVSALPKNKTGKIMRRILTKICKNDLDFGDTSMMADESVLKELHCDK